MGSSASVNRTRTNVVPEHQLVTPTSRLYRVFQQTDPAMSVLLNSAQSAGEVQISARWLRADSTLQVTVHKMRRVNLNTALNCTHYSLALILSPEDELQSNRSGSGKLGSSAQISSVTEYCSSPTFDEVFQFTDVSADCLRQSVLCLLLHQREDSVSRNDYAQLTWEMSLGQCAIRLKELKRSAVRRKWMQLRPQPQLQHECSGTLDVTLEYTADTSGHNGYLQIAALKLLNCEIVVGFVEFVCRVLLTKKRKFRETSEMKKDESGNIEWMSLENLKFRVQRDDLVKRSILFTIFGIKDKGCEQIVIGQSLVHLHNYLGLSSLEENIESQEINFKTEIRDLSKNMKSSQKELASATLLKEFHESYIAHKHNPLPLVLEQENNLKRVKLSYRRAGSKKKELLYEGVLS